MKNDFAQIYPDGVVPAEEQYVEPEWTAEPEAEELPNAA